MQGVGYVSENGEYPRAGQGCIRGLRAKPQHYLCRRCGAVYCSDGRDGTFEFGTPCLTDDYPHAWLMRTFIYDSWVVDAQV